MEGEQLYTIKDHKLNRQSVKIYYVQKDNSTDENPQNIGLFLQLVLG